MLKDGGDHVEKKSQEVIGLRMGFGSRDFSGQYPDRQNTNQIQL